MSNRYTLRVMKHDNGYLIDAIAMSDDGGERTMYNICTCDPEVTGPTSFIVREMAHNMLASLGCADPVGVEIEVLL